MSATATVNADILDAIRSPHLFAPWFRNLNTWAAWFVFLRAMFCLPMNDADRALFTECTGRAEPPKIPPTEVWLIVGRRGGKSQVLATVAVFLAVFKDWSQHLVPGESAQIMVVATDRRQARIIHRYTRAMLNVPTLSSLIASETDSSIELVNGLSIEIGTASYRAVRGYTVVAALIDEVAFLRSDDTAANPDSEIIAALKPAMATTRGGMLLCASSPYARRGELWNTFRKHYGRDDSPVLVWKAGTAQMNPSVPRHIIDEAFEADPASAAAEYGAEFRTDIESFVSREAIDACTPELNRREVPPRAGVGTYEAFVDPSGGSGDSMTLAIAHREGDRGVLDALREVRPPFSPESVVEEFADLLKRYGVRVVTGDRYGGEWPRERFHVHEIRYEPSERSKNDIYRELLPLINSRKVELLDHPRLTAQLVGLERRTARGGRDTVDHAPGGHDDVANAAAGALVGIAGKPDWLEVWRKL